MTLKSNLFKLSRGLAACEIHDAAHFTVGKQGDDVGRIQMALLAVDSLRIDRQELLAKSYGGSTAAAVLAFKTKRKIVNHHYQNKPDSIVGKMTIAALDHAMYLWEATQRIPGDCVQGVGGARTGFHPQLKLRPDIIRGQRATAQNHPAHSAHLRMGELLGSLESDHTQA